MSREEAIIWIINLSADLGKVEHHNLWHYEQALDEIRELLEVDAVPVVRCKDCKYAYMTDDGYCNWCDIMADLGLEYDAIHLPGDWFCADGKKVTDNEQTN